MPNKNVKKGGKMGKALAVGAGVAAASAAAYLLLGPDGKKNRAKVKAFANKAKDAAMKNKEIMAMAGAAAAGMRAAKSKAKSVAKKGISKMKSGAKRGMATAKSGAKKVMGTAKKVAKKAVGKAKKATR